jgi:hypothetical protein
MSRRAIQQMLIGVTMFSMAHTGTPVAAEPVITLAPAPMRPLIAEIFDPEYIESDCSYHGVRVAEDGSVYFTLSSHSLGNWTRLYRFDPRSEDITLLWSPQSITPDTGHVVQGKIHSPPAECDGRLFVATHSGHYREDHTLSDGQMLKPYKGGYVYAVDLETGVGEVVAAPLHDSPYVVPMGDQRVPIAGEALISTIMDRERGLFYALSWPGAEFVRVDVNSREVRQYGRVQDGAEAVPRHLSAIGDGEPAINPRYQQCCRTLGLDDEGNVFGSTGYGEIWRYDRLRDEIVTVNARLDSAAPAETRAGKPPYLNQWRTIVWDDDQKVFYGVHWASSWLFRFDPKTERIDPVMRWGPVDLQIMDHAQLGLSLGHDRVLYGLVHAPAIKPGVQRSVHLITLDLDTMIFKDHGNVVSADGRTLMFAESCDVAPNGDVYTVGWMEVPTERIDQVRQRRRDGGVPEVQYTFVMSLVRIPAERIGRSE